MNPRRQATLLSKITWVVAVTAVACGAASCSLKQDAKPKPTAATATAEAPSTASETTSTDGATASGTPVGAADASYGHVELPGLVATKLPPVKNDPAVVTGTLDNGLRYFVQNNDNPGGSAELRLVINAGSVDEQGPTGVAHFVEHMMFNGTEAYPKNQLVDVLRGFGAQFGADVNAYTSFDETVYELDVPANTDALSTGLNVLSQWLSHVTFDPAEVEAERGVVLDEWRTRTQTPEGRLRAISLPLYYAGTPYADRLTIGTEADIQSATPEDLRAFYQQWYRPTNAAVVVVGDVKVDAVVQQVKDLFAPAADATAEPARPDTSIEGLFTAETPPGYALHSDPDQPTVNVEIGLPLAALPADDPLSWQADIYDSLIFDMLIRRLTTDVENGTAPFDEVIPGTDSFTENMDAPALYAFTDADRSAETMQALLDEYERVARYGFNDGEVAISVEGVRSQLDSMSDGAESTQDKTYASQIVDHVLTKSPYMTVPDQHAVASALLDGVTADGLRQRFLARWTNTAPYLIVSTPESDAAAVPTKADLDRAVKGLSGRDLKPRESNGDVPDQLMVPPTPVEPTDRVRMLRDAGIDVFDPVELTYPNGVRVVVNPSTIVEGQVFVSATSAGGRSVLEPGQIPDAVYAPEVVLGSGVGDFSRTQLSDIMSAADIELGATIDTYTEGFRGTFASRDADMALAYMHLLMTAPRVDESAMSSMTAANQPLVDNPSTDADLSGFDALIDARYGDNSPEMVLPSPEQFATVDAAGVKAVWTDRFSNATDWVFVFSGDVKVDDFVKLSNAYLGTLPSDGPDRPAVDVSGTMPGTATSKTVQAGTGDTAQATVYFETPLASADAKTQATMIVANKVIDARLTTVVREQFGASYSPQAVLTTADDPDYVSQSFLIASGAPDSMDALNQLLVQQIADVGANGPTPDEFSKALAEATEQYNYVNNDQFLDVLTAAEFHPDRDLGTFLGQFRAVGTVTASDVQAYVAQHLPASQYIDVTVIPVS